MQVTGAGVWDCDPETREMFIAPEMKDALGFADEEIANHLDAWLARVHPGDLARLAGEFERVVNGAASSFELEHRVLTKDGETHWLLSRGSAIHDANGKTVRLIGTCTDITERKRSESAFRAIFEGSPDGMMLIDTGGAGGRSTIFDSNSLAATMHGYERLRASKLEALGQLAGGHRTRFQQRAHGHHGQPLPCAHGSAARKPRERIHRHDRAGHHPRA